MISVRKSIKQKLGVILMLYSQQQNIEIPIENSLSQFMLNDLCIIYEFKKNPELAYNFDKIYFKVGLYI